MSEKLKKLIEDWKLPNSQKHAHHIEGDTPLGKVLMQEIQKKIKKDLDKT